MQKMFMAAVFVAAATIGIGAVAADRHECGAEVDRKLAELGIASGDVTQRLFYRELGADGEGVLIGYYAWLRVKACPTGWLVLNLSTACYELQTFTDGPCRIAGVKPG